MNKVYLSKEGKVYLNGQEVPEVSSISVKTTWMGSNVVLELEASYKCDYHPKTKTHPLNECAKE